MLFGLATGVEFGLEGWPLLGIEFHAVHFRIWAGLLWHLSDRYWAEFGPSRANDGVFGRIGRYVPIASGQRVYGTL